MPALIARPIPGPELRRRPRSCAGPQLFVAGHATSKASSYIEPHETPFAINGHPCRLLTWTAEEWDQLGAMQPTGTMKMAGGVRGLLVVD